MCLGMGAVEKRHGKCWNPQSSDVYVWCRQPFLLITIPAVAPRKVFGFSLPCPRCSQLNWFLERCVSWKVRCNVFRLHLYNYSIGASDNINFHYLMADPTAHAVRSDFYHGFLSSCHIIHEMFRSPWASSPYTIVCSGTSSSLTLARKSTGFRRGGTPNLHMYNSAHQDQAIFSQRMSIERWNSLKLI